MMKIGVVSLAAWMKPELITKGVERLQMLGHEVHVHPNNYKKDLIYAGTPAERAAAFIEYMSDTSFDVVLATRAIHGALHVIDMLVKADYPTDAPPFVGYSDNSIALVALTAKKGLRCVHGPMLVDIAGSVTDDEINQMLACAVGDDAAYDVGKIINNTTEVIRPGKATGRLVGGNLVAVNSMMGTPFDWQQDDVVFFFEDLNEYLFRIDRIMQQYKLGGKIDKMRGVIIGDFSNVQTKGGNHEFDIDIWQYFKDFFSDANFPVIAKAGFGHTGPRYSLLMGDEVTIEAPAKGRPRITRTVVSGPR